MGMKSPVAYGAGNAKLRGKKIKVMRCGCCVAFDFRDKCKEQLAKKEIREYNSHVAQG